MSRIPPAPTLAPQYHDLTTRLLHALLALHVIGLSALGLWMVELSYYHPWYYRSLELHKAFGLLAGLVVLLKLGWRLVQPPLPPPATLGPWQAGLARSVHGLLLGLTVFLVATGYLLSTSTGQPVSLFGWTELPALLERSDARGRSMGDLHTWAAWVTIGLVTLHFGAALLHGLVKRDGTLRRMFW
jgi:cytochrome b561